MFSSFNKAKEEEKLHMINCTTISIVERGFMILKFTSDKKITLLNVLHVPKMWWNLISNPIIIEKGFKIVFESDKFVLSKMGRWGKGTHRMTCSKPI